MIELRPVETEADVDVFLALRTAIDPEHLLSRAAYLEEIKRPERDDFIATLDGEPAGAHSSSLTGTTSRDRRLGQRPRAA